MSDIDFVVDFDLIPDEFKEESFVVDFDLIPDELKSDKKRKIGVLESTRMKAQQASGETYADTAWDTTRAIGESVLPFSGKIRNIRSNMETKAAQELIQRKFPDNKESGRGFKIDPSREFSSVSSGERSKFDTEIDNLAARAGIDSEGMKYAEELSGGDPRKKLEILQSFAKAGLANKTANKEAASSELSVTRQSVLGKIGSGAIDNSGYSLEYAVGSAVGLPGVLAGVAGAAERFSNLTTPDYEIDPETGEAVSRDNQDSDSDAALKAGVGAAMEVGLEIGTEAILGAFGRGVAGVIGKAVGKSGKAVRQAGKDAARQYSRGTAKQLEKSVVGRTILRSGKAYDELTKITGINSLPIEWVEEIFQDPADSLTGVGSKSADFDFKTELRKYMDRASSREYHTDIILGMLGTTAIQGAGAAVQQYQRDSKQSRNDDGFLKAYGLSDESIGTLNARDKQFLRRVFSNPSMTPEKAQRALRSFGEKANMAAKAIIDQEGYDFEAN
ncbi:MAG: hypothetical protein GX763_03055, partial [Clostridiaceae bacterium]|nr:hypothetical protein [Clostridiaceae bacterium]